MVNKHSFWKILVVLGFLNVRFVNAQTDDLTGTWTTNIGDYTQVGSQLEMKFNNGNFETTLDGKLLSRGIYTASSGKYTTQTTYVHGGAFDNRLGLQSRWYSQEQLRTVLRPIYTQIMSVEDFNTMIDEMFSIETGTYSLKGNILTMKKDDQIELLTYRRK